MIRYGHSWPAGRGRSWVSAPAWAWLLAWWLLLPFTAAVLAGCAAVWLCVAAVRLAAIAVLLAIAGVRKWRARHA